MKNLELKLFIIGIFLFPITAFFFHVGHVSALTTLDSYDTSHYSSGNWNDVGQSGSGDQNEIGQCLTTPNDGVSYTLDSAQFYLLNHGGTTGTSHVRLFATTGTYGSTCKPTGSALATSDSINNSSITGTVALYTFTFSGAERITLSPNTHYSLIYSVPTGDANGGSKYIQLFWDSPGSHSGNDAISSNDGSTYTARDIDDIFFLFGTTSGTSTPPEATSTATTTPWGPGFEEWTLMNCIFLFFVSLIGWHYFFSPTNRVV